MKTASLLVFSLGVLAGCSNSAEPKAAAVTNGVSGGKHRIGLPRVSADEFCEFYKENVVRASRTFEGKQIALTGMVREIGFADDNSIRVIVDTTGPSGLDCTFDAGQSDAVARLKPGDFVILAGTVSEGNSPGIHHCQIVQNDYQFGKGQLVDFRQFQVDSRRTMLKKAEDIQASHRETLESLRKTNVTLRNARGSHIDDLREREAEFVDKLEASTKRVESFQRFVHESEDELTAAKSQPN